MKSIYQLSLLIMVSVLSGCQAIGTIFKGGMWFGIILVVGIALIVLVLISRNKK